MFLFVHGERGALAQDAVAVPTSISFPSYLFVNLRGWKWFNIAYQGLVIFGGLPRSILGVEKSSGVWRAVE